MDARIPLKKPGLEPWEEMITISTPPIPQPYTNYPNLYYILIFCNHFIVPVIIFTGIVGNVLAFFVFVSSSLKRLPTSVYLAALAFADCSFLLCLGAGWLDNFRFSFFQQEAVCTCVVYMTYVFSFLSVWFVVCFTTEMYLTLFHEDLAARINYVTRARFVVCCLALLSGCLYLHAFWTTKQVRTGNNQETCVFVADDHVRMAVALTDSFLTLLLPYTLLIFMNTRILLVIIGFSRRKGPGEGQGGVTVSSTPGDLRLQPIDEFEESETGARQSCSAGDLAQPVTEEITTALSSGAPDTISAARNSDGKKNPGLRCSTMRRGSRHSSSTPKTMMTSSSRIDITGKRSSFGDDGALSGYEAKDLEDFDLGLDGLSIRLPRKQRKTMHRKITEMQRQSFKMLLTVAMIFLILNLPSHAIRLQGLIRSFFTPNYVTSETEHICQQFFQVLYYFNFMANFVIYNACAKSFRAAILSLPYVITKACRRKDSKRSERKLTSHRIGEALRRMREEQNSRLVEVNLAELHISKMESFDSDFKYQSPPCLLKNSKTEEETSI